MTSKKPLRVLYKKIIPIFILLSAALIGGFFLKDILSFESLRDNRDVLIAWRDEYYFLAMLGFVFAYITLVAFSLPGALIMTLSGGFLFGIFPGALLNIFAATLGAIAIFSAAKMGLGDALYQKMQKFDSRGVFGKMTEEINKNEISYLLLMRLVPVFPFFIANLAPAFLKVKLRNFALTTFIGIMPGGIVYTSIGAGLGDIFTAGETPNLGIIFEPYILLPLMGLCLMAALPIIISKFRKGVI